LGLTKVADNPIGTAFVRGLSGGQRKRVEIGTELVAAPLVLFLDEPTSGLDASIAFEVLSSIRSIVRASGGKLSVMLSIHQPNARILELFDHIMLLGGGGMSYFGTVPDSVKYFTSIGFPPPKEYTPTDYFLQISDPHFGSRSDFNFLGSFASSFQCGKLQALLDKTSREGSYGIKKTAPTAGNYKTIQNSLEEGAVQTAGYEDFVDTSHGETSFWRQYYMLVKRDLVLAKRDPALYYLQFVLVLAFGFLVGAAFYKLKYEIGSTMNNVPAAVLW
jgi:ABC-type multidrug transport system ATPase subunit